MRIVIYFLVALFATGAGSIAGLGGGIIIKPLLDIMNDYSVQTIGVLSSITVLAMSVVSVGKQALQKTRIDYRIAIPLAVGAAVGGICGQNLLSLLIGAMQIGSVITVIQNSILLILVIIVFIYMRNREKIKSRKASSIPVSIITGLFLGLISSFLGIGGGPINVALMMYLFSFDIKTATVCSIITILFSQLANVGIVAVTSGFGAYDLTMLPPMVIGAVLGGFVGAGLNKRMSDKAVEYCFELVQVLVFGFAVFNIIRNVIL